MFRCFSSQEIETEQKFEDGMLAKLSKITDLISKLEAFSASEDGTRVKKSSSGQPIRNILDSFVKCIF